LAEQGNNPGEISGASPLSVSRETTTSTNKTNMLRIQSLDKLMTDGHLDDVYKDVRRYGDITSDSTQEDNNGIETRSICIEHKGRIWSFGITLGEVHRAGWEMVE
jgi:hypothetical protein